MSNSVVLERRTDRLFSAAEQPFRTKLRSRIRSNSWPGLYVFPWIVPAGTSLYLKYILMVGTSYGPGGFDIAAQSLGRKEELGFAEKLSFFLVDIIVALIVPIVLLVLGRILSHRLRILLTVMLSAGVTLALYAQLRALAVVGQFLSFPMFVTAIRWGLHEPLAYIPYLGSAGLLVVSVAGAFVAGVFWLVSDTRGSMLQPTREGLASFSGLEGVCLVCVLPLLFVSWLPLFPSTPYHSSVLLRALGAYWHEQDVRTGEFAGLSTSALLFRYREFTHAPSPERDPAYWGKETGANVLFFVLETMPARFLPPDGEMDDLPNLKHLREKSFVAVRHYTTFPRTHEAIFSLLSSWYPSDVTRPFEEQHPDLRVPGIMRTLSAQGYVTAIYSPMRRWGSLDTEMFQVLGVRHQFYPPGALLPPATRPNLRAKWATTRITRDLATKEFMKWDLERCLARGQNFAAVFLPQISHLPYPAVAQIGDLPTRARVILKIEDAWLGELVQMLGQHHQLDNTVIVITGDHGIRTSQEDPSFRSGMIDDYSFHVPLLIYSPKALQHSLTIPWLTSHIDVAPTVLDLLGIERGREFEQGAPIWNADIAKRQTYFFAGSMFGADGYYSDGRFYMRQLMSDSVYASSSQDFHTSDMARKNSAGYSQVSRSLCRMVGLQQVVAAHFSQVAAVRNHLFSSIRPGD